MKTPHPYIGQNIKIQGYLSYLIPIHFLESYRVWTFLTSSGQKCKEKLILKFLHRWMPFCISLSLTLNDYKLREIRQNLWYPRWNLSFSETLGLRLLKNHSLFSNFWRFCQLHLFLFFQIWKTSFPKNTSGGCYCHLALLFAFYSLPIVI